MKNTSNFASFNNELVNTIDSLKDKRSQLEAEISEEETKKEKVEQFIKEIKAQLEETKKALEKKYAYSRECERIINNTENAFVKILESSQTLLNIVKRDEINLQKMNKFD